METGYQVLGFALMGSGTVFVILGVLWEIGRFGIPWFYNVGLVLTGIGLVLLGQWLVL